MLKKGDLKRILECWEVAEISGPGKSTEWLMQMTCDVFESRYGRTIDHGDVAEALGADECK